MRRLLPDFFLTPPGAYAAMVKAIQGATDTLNLETYIFEDGAYWL